MAILYVANTGKQNYEFVYRLPIGGGKLGKTTSQTIQPGQQIKAYKDAPIDELELIVKQHRKYGLTDVHTLDRNRQRVDLVYSFDRVIDIDRYMQAEEQNTDAMRKQGLENMKLEAAALASHMGQQAQEMGIADVDGVEMEFVEEAKPGDSKKELLHTSVEVVKPNQEPRRQRGRKR